MERNVCIKNDRVMTTSKAIAETFQRRHGDVMDSIKDLIKTGHLGLREFSQSSYTNSQNKKQPQYLLTEKGFLIAMPFIGGSKSKDGQVRLVEEFLSMQKALNERHSSEWQQSRIKGKLMRRGETDAIAEYLIPLAKKQAPDSTYAKKPSMAYVNYSKLVKSALGVDWDSRADLNWEYLNAVEAIERMICVTIKKQCQIEVPYKTIYNECKTNALSLVELLCLDGDHLLVKELGNSHGAESHSETVNTTKIGVK